ncbi:MAG: histidinol dehydrogenase [Candidatus Magasanikbacteria bacterium RIFOXYD2_FULL_41_14]|uniref:Histidinol dehydrogenase n=1 Tax=Candidatus Magasanikbacteria bacterium RIFOXYD2_FULL_41_14 TaxID=1798709 RepID=A0A1F6PF73_9BACT|nr:MAG: histidinol dehydrogenase [Candidatus Magasanikbacteria bacterium RIFOXYD2_FULL_41_14]
MKIVKLSELKKNPNFKQIMKRSQQNYAPVSFVVKKIMAEVKLNGDEAVRKYTKKFDRVDIVNTKVSRQEIKEAYTKVSKEFLKALAQAIRNISLVQKNQMQSRALKIVRPVIGVRVWNKWQAIEKVGLYVPGGRAQYPSSVLMNGIPAKLAGCKNIAIATPPRSDGLVAPELLVAADKIGIVDIYKIGGAQAIAAFTYGTSSVTKVSKIVGPGNSYVAAAKLTGFVAGEISIDLPAGPSEVFIIADETVNPKFVAADLMADAEHGPDGAVVLITTSASLAQAVLLEIEKNIGRFSTQENIRNSINSFGLFALVETLDEAIVFANDYAPEHIQIMTKNASKVAKRITNAGSIFVGIYTCKSAGDYATGANHVLPTGGAAKMFGGLSVFDFMRLVECQSCDVNGLRKIKDTIETFASAENLPAHKYSCSVRFKGK